MKAIKFIALILLFSAILPFQACEKLPSEDEVLVCGVEDPINQLEWLNKRIKLLSGGPKMNGIVLYQYNDRQVIEIQCSVCNSPNMHQYYCDGTKLDFDDSTTYMEYLEFRKKRIEIKVIYGTKVW